MIQIIFGGTGTGKTKRLIQTANELFEASKGTCVFITNNKDSMFNLKHAIRYIDTRDYSIIGPKMFAGFLAGIAAQDFDIEYIFVDSFAKIINHPLDTLEELFGYLERFTMRCDIKIILSINIEDNVIPDFLKQYTIGE